MADKFINMIMGARKADVDSIRELKNYIYEKSGVANKSLRALERTGGDTEYAYGRAMEFLNTEYQSIKFPQAVAKRPTSDLIKQAEFLEHWLGLDTRTVKGARQSKEDSIRGLLKLKDLGYNISADPERMARISKIMLRTGVKLVDDLRYEFIEMLDSAFENGYSEEEIEENVLRWQADDITYNSLVTIFKTDRSGLE
ncbi:MAG: hypothetical protein IIW92_10905 [Lachnospiraceae bacterium]|nr:hypothetical protein [Lachnospiraceae bacterium]